MKKKKSGSLYPNASKEVRESVRESVKKYNELSSLFVNLYLNASDEVKEQVCEILFKDTLEESTESE